MIASLALLPLPAAGQHPIALADSDLIVAGIKYQDDSSLVRSHLGKPTTVDSISWEYQGLRVVFDGPKVFQLQLTGDHFATARGLRVGDPIERITELYGGSCAMGAYVFCRTLEFGDERGIMVFVENGRVSNIFVGSVFDLD